MASTNLLVNTHYPMPWIVWKREYSFQVPGHDFAVKDFAHGLPFTPLLIGQWSTNPNFSPSYDLTVEVPGGATGGQVASSCLISANATNIRAVGDNSNSDNTETFYLRLMAFAPPNYTGDVNPVDYASPFRYNSRYRYQKLFLSGLASSGETVKHGLGYIPQARVWMNYDGYVSPYAGIIDTNGLKIDANTQYYYHIYLDEML